LEVEFDGGCDYLLVESLPPAALAEPLPDEIAHAAVERLKQEADRHWGIDPRRSLEFAERILAIGQARADQRQIALGLMARGDALKLIGRSVDAWEALEQAGKLFLETGDEVGWARTRIGRLALSKPLNRIPEALSEAEKAREIFRRYGEPEKSLRLEGNIAYLHNNLGELHKALDHYLAALAIASSLGEAGEAYFGALYISLGSTFEGLGDLRQAQAYYERAHTLFLARGEEVHLANVEANMAMLSQAQGHYRRALQLFDSALKRVEKHSPFEATKTRWHILECYVALNRKLEARELAHQISADYREFQNPYELALSLMELGTIEAGLANFAEALKTLEEAESIFSSLHAANLLALVHLRRSQIILKTGESQPAYLLASQAASVFRSAGQQVHYATALLVQGQSCMLQGNLAEAQTAAENALHIAESKNLPNLRYDAHLLLGRIRESGSALRRAERHFRAAVATTERVQRGLTITLHPGFLADKGEAWRALIALYQGEGRIAKAFETLERAKSLVVMGYLANRDRLRWARESGNSPALIDELEQLRAEHHRLYNAAHEPAPDGEQGHLEISSNSKEEIRRRERRMRAITEQLYFHSAEIHAVHPAPVPCTAELQGILDQDTLLVEFYQDGERLWAFTIDGRSIRLQRLPIDVNKLDELLHLLQANLAAALNLGPRHKAISNLAVVAHRILGELYSALVAPYQRQASKKGRLIIVPFSSLHYLPFHLLFDGSAYLIERHEVIVLPAAGLALQRSPKRKPGARVVAHSWEGRLPGTLREARLVLERFGGSLYAEESATRSVFESDPLQILHVAAHGQYRLDQPDLSFIRLADGQLYADDLLQQDLSYELVTLSACETGRADVSGGDELIGLGRGFLYAGAGALVVSQWRIPDTLTLHLMDEMYRILQGGASKAAALRSAQINLITEAGPNHPAFWGAFQLVGDHSPLSHEIDNRQKM
jgi:tetratricopeptide (TPR) repeat protein